jgi:hypothetical protein
VVVEAQVGLDCRLAISSGTLRHTGGYHSVLAMPAESKETGLRPKPMAAIGGRPIVK